MNATQYNLWGNDRLSRLNEQEEEPMTAIQNLVSIYRQMAILSRKAINPSTLMRESADVLNSANRQLFPDADSLTEVLAGAIMGAYDLRSPNELALCMEWARALVAISDRPEDWTGNRYELLRNAFVAAIEG